MFIFKCSNFTAITQQYGILATQSTHATIVDLFYGMLNGQQNNTTKLKFSFYCMEGGRVQLFLLREPPLYLKYLLGTKSGQLRKNIRAYNSIFTFTSISGRVDRSINRSKGSYVSRMSGQKYLRKRYLLPEID